MWWRGEQGCGGGEELCLGKEVRELFFSSALFVPSPGS